MQQYYQLAADVALVQVARNALDAVRANLKVTEEAARAGTVTSLDVQRATVEVERQSQQLTNAELEVKVVARTLASQTGVVADTAGGAPLNDDLHAEPGVDEFQATAPATPAVRAAALDRAAAERAVTGQRLSLLPALSGAASERYTNAVGFLGGHHTAYAASLSLVWALDFSTAPGIRARKAEAAAARAREEQTRLAIGDAIFRTWNGIDAGIARSRSARELRPPSAPAPPRWHGRAIARAWERSSSSFRPIGTPSPREAGRIQADADLLNARAQLRLLAGAAAN